MGQTSTACAGLYHDSMNDSTVTRNQHVHFGKHYAIRSNGRESVEMLHSLHFQVMVVGDADIIRIPDDIYVLPNLGRNEGFRQMMVN